MTFHCNRTGGRSLCRSFEARPWMRLTVVALAVFLAGLCPLRVFSAEKPPEVLDSVRKALEFFRKNASSVSSNESGLVVYTCISAGMSPDDPYVTELINKILLKFKPDEYKPEFHHDYEAAVDVMALVAADKQKYRDKIQIVANHLLKNQRPNGSWDYPGQNNGGDTSITQYGMLGLWAASRAGVEIPVKALDLAAAWHLQTQQRNGSFSYHPLGTDNAIKHSMTVAGVGSMGIARLLMSRSPQELQSLADEAEAKTKKNDKAFGVLERVTVTETPDQPAATAAAVAPADANYKPQVSPRELEAKMKLGLGWLATNYTVDKNATGWHLYYLYGLERAASLANVEKIGGHDWYTEGYRIILKLQDADGGWVDIGGQVAATSFAVLFLVRATEKLVPNASPPKAAKAATFGGGLLAGGRGLPTDLANVQTKDGSITAKKMDTPLDKLLAELENPKSQKVESAQAALVEAVQIGQREQLIGQKDLLLKLTKDPRVEVRRTAFWALARCNDLRVAPVLIQGLMDADFDAAVEARNALCVLSRRPRGFGLPDDLIAKLPENASQAEKDSAFEKWRDADIRRWREWYQSVRPYSERDKLPD